MVPQLVESAVSAPVVDLETPVLSPNLRRSITMRRRHADQVNASWADVPLSSLDIEHPPKLPPDKPVRALPVPPVKPAAKCGASRKPTRKDKKGNQQGRKQG